ncbi:MAG: TetR/AcrR family transcriptional regulator [Oscillospiraceae bacterium]|jgi:AcrR family transcriptional regulator|nr:TetR family transcriptional regulator [Oscillospiraceae bacterium]MDE6932187.1 TetR/AcrR family transcriptional regulator [Oscillospiraceae bacterium]
MPNFTRRAIKESFLKLLNQRPLNQITVKDIVEDCGINRNSFYYHFSDLPALVEEIMAEQVSAMVENHPTVDSVQEGSDAIVEFVMHNKRAIYHIYNSVSRDVFERHLMEVCRYVVTTYLDGMLEEVEEADRDAILRFHRCACFGSVIDWLNGGMKDDVSDYFRRIRQLRLGLPEK